MNILIVSDDGPAAKGLAILQQAAATRWPEAKRVTMTPVKSMTGQSMAVTATRDPRQIQREEVAKDKWVVTGKPADVIYLAMYHPDQFLNHPEWDLVLAGVNHGQNVGLDVYHSGTVGMVMLASAGFGVAAVAFSQQMEETEPDGSPAESARFVNTDKFILNILASLAPTPGECFNVNFPAGPPKGWRHTRVAPFSRWRPPATHSVKGPLIDHFELEAGYISISELSLRVNSTVRY